MYVRMDNNDIISIHRAATRTNIELYSPWRNNPNGHKNGERYFLETFKGMNIILHNVLLLNKEKKGNNEKWS